MTLGGGVLLVLRTQTRHSRAMSDDIPLWEDTAEASRAVAAIGNGIVCLTYVAAMDSMLYVCFYLALQVNTSKNCNCNRRRSFLEVSMGV